MRHDTTQFVYTTTRAYCDKDPRNVADKRDAVDLESQEPGTERLGWSVECHAESR